MVLQDAPRLPVTLHLRPDYGRTAFLQNVCSPLLPSTTSRGRESYIHHEHTGIRSAMRSLPKATAASNAGAARKSRGRAGSGVRRAHTPGLAARSGGADGGGRCGADGQSEDQAAPAPPSPGDRAERKRFAASGAGAPLPRRAASGGR